MAVELESKYLYNGFPYLEKDLMRSGDANLPTNVVMKLMTLLFKQGFNVACDNYFTSFDLSMRLAKRQCSLMGTIISNRREIPNFLKERRMLQDTLILHSTDDTTATNTSYQSKKSKSVNILSTLHEDAAIPENNSPKRNSETVLFYNQTKVGGDVFDQMSRLHSVKAASRWPVHVFYNVIDMALINCWVVYKVVCKTIISCRMYIK